jgi:hypothetical protein
MKELEGYHFPKVKDLGSSLQILFLEFKESVLDFNKELVQEFN